MISLELAQALNSAGLEWTPALHDFLAIPDRDLDESFFVIRDVQVITDIFLGNQVVSF